MKILFDTNLITANRLRAFKKRSAYADFLLKIVASELGSRLTMINRNFNDAVELHGTTGVVSRACLATGKILRMKRVETSQEFSFADEEIVEAPLDELPLAPKSMDLILSPLNLHIINNVPKILVEIHRSLKPGGLFLAAIPGVGTLTELRQALLKAETEINSGTSPRVIPFADVKSIGDLMQQAGFSMPVVDQEIYPVYYNSLFQLINDLRMMGMSNPLVARSRKPVRKSFFLRAAELYEKQKINLDERIVATFSIIYASGWSS
ncbi:SAM-dependent methyltransferase, BioC-like protein [Liberibacter crescens BT-1]|uniref:SAM-dependent methyltransferase, BioC-like protein n=1 Tax=Liberibacter crescens (strain BT-1) TaxID=1215343 RepID=L0EXG6_LIBCB|nr:methyltransferase domain-containing protein [Liberibacter crescens]AGA65061.1 SAM-dependent methyltransferase, BioC-like protein [Liberibacter crescens BT-1]